MTIKEMNARLREINKEAEKTDDSEVLNKLLIEANDLKAKIVAAENRKHLQKLADGAVEEPDNAHGGEDGADPEDSASKRGKALKAGNVISRKFAVNNVISSSAVPLTSHTAQDVNPAFNQVSSLLDLVKPVYLQGGESYKRGFVKGYGEGDYTEEGADYTETEPEFGYAEMTKTKITAYCEEPEEMQKLAASAYDGIIGSSSEIAVRKKLSRQILVGEGGEGKLYGIFYNPATKAKDIIDRDKDISISEINDKTLDEIIYSYGGDENVEGVAALVLNKMDLKAFATLRNADGKKVYTVVNNGNVGTIDTVPYIINSACKAISNPSTAEGAYSMAYGHLSNYELAIFSDMDVQRSTEYKFKQGQIAHRADIFVGGNVAAYNGFLRVKKKVSLSDNELLTVSSTASDNTAGNTRITVTEALGDGNSYKYKVAATPTIPTVGSVCSSGYTNWNGTDEIPAESGKKIVVVEVDPDNKAVAVGVAVITVKE